MIEVLTVFLSSIKWYWKLLVLMVSSLISTMLPIPIVSFVDISFMGTMGHFNSVWWVIAVVLLTTAFDTAFALVTYSLSHKLSRVIVRNEKKRQKLNDLMLKVERQAPLWLFVAGATPFPFTLAIYAAATLNYDKKKFVIIMAISRFVKYAAIALLFSLGYYLLH